MSSDPNSFAGTWKWTAHVPYPDDQLPLTSVNILVSPDLIFRVTSSSPDGLVEADNVVFANGVLNCSITIDGDTLPVQMKMRQDGNMDLTIDYGGFLYMGKRLDKARSDLRSDLAFAQSRYL
jgi:hypothetical protein